jgi:hypothetical protein
VIINISGADLTINVLRHLALAMLGVFSLIGTLHVEECASGVAVEVRLGIPY